MAGGGIHHNRYAGQNHHEESLYSTTVPEHDVCQLERSALNEVPGPCENTRLRAGYQERGRYHTIRNSKVEEEKQTKATGTPQAPDHGNNPHRSIDILFQQVCAY
ncbi:MAG: hypothetical protein WBB55_13340 [Anaerolineales bacterium]